MEFILSKEVDLYIKKQDVEKNNHLIAIRELIIKTVPNCIETTAWNMPSYKLKKYVIHFAAHKHHLGIYPGPKAIDFFKEELERFHTTKGAIQIPYTEKLPTALIKKIIKYNIKMNED